MRRRCSAASGRSVLQTLALFFIQFLVLGVVASAAGVALALAGQQVLVSLLASVVATDLPPPAWAPGVAAFCAGLLLLFGFALPPLVALAHVPPLRVLRRDLPRPRAGGVLAYVLGAATIALLIGWQAGEVQAGLIMVGGVAALLLVAALAAWALLALLKRLPQRGVTWRFGLANLRRRAFASSLQIGALALGLMALLLLTVVRGDLMRDWRASLPPDAPNQFLINVLPDQVDDARAQLAKGIGADVAFRPMVRGRLVAVNDAVVDTSKYADVRARRLAEREFNLSWTDALPKGNRILRRANSGNRVRQAPTPGMSLEEGIAETLGVKLGDLLTFDIAGTQVSARVTSLRKVDWDSFRVNFFALFPPGPLDAMPATYIAAFRAPDGNNTWLPALLQKNPNILAIDIGDIVRQVQAHRRQRVARGRVRVPVHAGGRAAGAAGGHRRDAGRAQVRRGHPAHARRIAAAARERADRRIPAAGRAGGSGRRRGRHRHRLGAGRARVQVPVRSGARWSGSTASSAARWP